VALSVPDDVAKSLYRLICRIRCVEEKIARLYPSGVIRCPVHLCIGQEAVPAAVCSLLQKMTLCFVATEAMAIMSLVAAHLAHFSPNFMGNGLASIRAGQGLSIIAPRNTASSQAHQS